MTRVFVATFLLTCFSHAQAKLFVPDLEPWEFWTPHDEQSVAQVDHALWQALLDVYLVTDVPDGIYRFDYAAVSAADRDKLKAYLAMLASVDPRNYARAEQYAYWINFYNALTVETVLEHYPVKSIRKIYGGIFDTGPWDEKLAEVSGQPLSLNDIEHRILRPIWRDPRIHYAVNCASLGCPNLAASAYTAANTEALLEAGARGFVNHPSGVLLKDGRLRLSSIYNWYDTDFGADQEALLAHIASYAEEPLAEQLKNYTGRLKYAYDWQLNELPR